MPGRIERGLVTGSRTGNRAASRRPSPFAWTLLVWAVILASIPGSALDAANGDLLDVMSELSNEDLVDICAAPDGTYWVASRSKGKIFHLDNSLARIDADEIASPFGAFDLFNNPVLTRGLAYRAVTDSLLVLALNSPVGVRGTFLLREVKLDGTPVGAAVPVVSPRNGTADLHGLSWDPLADLVWYLDAENDLVVRSNLNGQAITSFSLPGDVPTETTLFGNALDFELHPNGATGFVHVAYGDILTLGPDRIERLSLPGLSTGISIPFPEEIGTQIFGFALGESQGNDVVVVLGSDSGGSMVYLIDREVKLPAPPSELRCAVDIDGDVQLTWRNNGIGLGGIYPAGIQLFVDRKFHVLLSGSTTSFVHRDPPEEEIEYGLRGLDGLGASDFTSCRIRTGEGALIDWIPFPGERIYDLCRNPANGDIYATDAGAGKIYRFNEALQLYPDLPVAPNPLTSPFDRPGGIAFHTDGDGGNGSLMIARTDGVLMRELSLFGVPIDVGIPMNPPSRQNVVSGMTYDPVNKIFTYVDIEDHSLVSIDRFGNIPAAHPPVQPPDFLTGFPHRGIAHNPITEFVLVTFEGGSRVRELFRNGNPGGADFGSHSIGESVRRANAIGGIEVAENVLLVAGIDANAIFRLLIAPRGGEFLRGDSNSSSTIDVSDAVFTAVYLFVTGSAPECEDAADINDDGRIDLSDSVHTLFFVFLGGTPPPKPFPRPGIDPTFQDQLRCQRTVNP